MSFEKFKAMQSNENKIFESLVKEVEKAQKKDYAPDPRFWKPTFNEKTGTAAAIIRFLPAIDGESVPYVGYYMHNFRASPNAGPVFKEKCPTSIGRDDCAVCLANRELMEINEEKNKPLVSIRKRKLVYVSNIYVVADSKNPEAEGKVFLYAYGSTIFEKISQALHPKFESDPKFNPFHMVGGANFKMKVYYEKVGQSNMPQYDQSSFDSVSPLFTDEKKAYEVWQKEYPLAPFIDPTTFKSYEELKKQLDRIVNWKSRPKTGSTEAKEEALAEDVPFGNDMPIEASFDKAVSGAAAPVDDVEALLSSIVGD